jgi:hypothetical protein
MLTKESNELIKELKHKTKYKNLLENTHLKKLFHKLESSEFDYDMPEIVHKTGKYPCNQFMVKRLFNKSLKYPHISSLKWSSNSTYSVNISLNVYSNNSREINPERLNLLVYALSFICSFSNRNRNITIHLVLLGDKKKYTGKFTRNEINTAGCKFNDFTAEICVWRLEECIKVLFHECIHALRFSSVEDSKEIIEKYNQKYNCNSEVLRIDETYTEIWARILNCYFVAKLTSFQEEDLDLYKYFCILLGIEREFSFLQGFKVGNELKKINNEVKNNPKKDPNKETSVVSYYIGTAEIFNNFEDFLIFCFRDNNPLYLKDGRLFNSFLLGCKGIPVKRLNKENKSYDTMRMTAIELKI